MMTISLETLPLDIVFIIAQSLDFEDVFNLRHSCSEMTSMIGPTILNRRLVEAVKRHIRHSPEARLAEQEHLTYDSAAKRVFDRREAFATCQPVSVSIVGCGTDMLFRQGTLCYRTDEVVRMLNLHESADREQVIDLREVVLRSTTGVDKLRRWTYTILNYADGILTCLCEMGKPVSHSYLLILCVQPASTESDSSFFAIPLECTTKIFARNNGSYLFWGTHSDIGVHSHHEWVICGVDLNSRKQLDGKIHLRGFVGSELGLTVCFEIFDDYFYALSNQTSFDVEEIDWTSYFHCYRFPVNRAKQQNLQMKDDIWRRNHDEGPLVDSWTALKLDRDEQSGHLMVVETRREWHSGGSASRRIHYTQRLIMPDPATQTDPPPAIAAQLAASNGPIGDAITTPLPNVASATTAATELVSMEAQPGPAVTTAPPRPSALAGPPGPSCRTVTAELAFSSQNAAFHGLPDEPLTQTLTAGDKPNFSPPQARLPRNVYPADDDTPPTYILAKTKVRHYSPNSQSFLDLVDHPITPVFGSGVYSAQQFLRLRISGRRLCGPSINPQTGLLLPTPIDPDTGDPTPEALEVYADREEGVRIWPALPSVDDTPEDKLLHEIMNPTPRSLGVGARPSHGISEGAGDVHGFADERSVIYMTGLFNSNEKAIVFVNFDEAIQLEKQKTRLPDTGVIRRECQGTARSRRADRPDTVLPTHLNRHPKPNPRSTDLAEGPGSDRLQPWWEPSTWCRTERAQYLDCKGIWLKADEMVASKTAESNLKRRDIDDNTPREPIGLTKRMRELPEDRVASEDDPECRKRQKHEDDISVDTGWYQQTATISDDWELDAMF